MGEIKITILGNPLSVNQTYKTRRASRMMYLSEKATTYAMSVRLQARSQWHSQPIKEDLEVSYFYYFSDKKRRDHLNFNKLLNDHLNQRVWRDDSQILISHHYTKFDKSNPRIEIFIKKLNINL